MPVLLQVRTFLPPQGEGRSSVHWAPRAWPQEAPQRGPATGQDWAVSPCTCHLASRPERQGSEDFGFVPPLAHPRRPEGV